MMQGRLTHLRKKPSDLRSRLTQAAPTYSKVARTLAQTLCRKAALEVYIFYLKTVSLSGEEVAINTMIAPLFGK